MPMQELLTQEPMPAVTLTSLLTPTQAQLTPPPTPAVTHTNWLTPTQAALMHLQLLHTPVITACTSPRLTRLPQST
jgi:hypothetical protein